MQANLWLETRLNFFSRCFSRVGVFGVIWEGKENFRFMMNTWNLIFFQRPCQRSLLTGLLLDKALDITVMVLTAKVFFILGSHFRELHYLQAGTHTHVQTSDFLSYGSKGRLLNLLFSPYLDTVHIFSSDIPSFFFVLQCCVTALFELLQKSFATRLLSS